VTSKPDDELVACTRKVPSSSGECDLEQPHSPSSGGHLRYPGIVTPDAHEKPRLDSQAWLSLRMQQQYGWSSPGQHSRCGLLDSEGEQC
jgi:hypothetical protein